MAPSLSFRPPSLLASFLLFSVFFALYNFFTRELCSNGNLDFKGSPSSGHAVSHSEHSSEPPLLRVYMYDLPTMFNLGLITEYWNQIPPRADGRKRKRVGLYPDHQHMAEWYLYEDLLNSTSENGTNSTAIRVFDPSSADVFFVPFFSSLSLRVYPPNSSHSISSDGLLQKELFEWLHRQPAWQHSFGSDHVIPCQHPSTMSYVVPSLQNSVLLVSDFAKFGPKYSSLEKDVILPYVHRMRVNLNKKEMAKLKHDGGSQSLQRRSEERNILLYFRGGRFRKEGGSIRDTLFKLLQNESDVVMEEGKQDVEGRKATSQGMKNSKFCLSPEGDTPTSCRLFDSILSSCIPVIVSDDIVLPFEDQIDYTKFAVFVSKKKAIEPGFLVTLLRNKIGEEKQNVMRNELIRVSQFFEYEHPGEAINMIWRKIHSKVPGIRERMNRLKRLALL